MYVCCFIILETSVRTYHNTNATLPTRPRDEWRRLLDGYNRPSIITTTLPSVTMKNHVAKSTVVVDPNIVAKPVRKQYTSHWSSMKGPECVMPFYKRIQGTTVVVDAFQYSQSAQSTHFFLSHWHSDHYAVYCVGFFCILV